jgi:hypothetical protein
LHGEDVQQVIDLDDVDASSLAKALLHRKTDRMPHVEARIANKALLEFVLQRSLPYQQEALESGKQAIGPLDYVEFSHRAGLDAIPCEINWLPEMLPSDGAQEAAGLVIKTSPPPPLMETFNRLEGYLRAAQGTRTGIYLSFSGLFSPAVQAAGIKTYAEAAGARLPELERLMDVLMRHQEKVIRAVCDRFAGDIAFAVIRDNVFEWPEMTAQDSLFQQVILPRLFRMTAPIREHSLLLGLNSSGRVEDALPVLYKHGFDLVQSLDPRCNDLPKIRQVWERRIAFMGGFPVEELVSGSRESVEERVKVICQGKSKYGGFVMGAAGDISADVRPELFLTLARAVHKCRG